MPETPKATPSITQPAPVLARISPSLPWNSGARCLDQAGQAHGDGIGQREADIADGDIEGRAADAVGHAHQKGDEHRPLGRLGHDLADFGIVQAAPMIGHNSQHQAAWVSQKVSQDQRRMYFCGV